MKKIFCALLLTVFWSNQIGAHNMAIVEEFMETLSNWSKVNDVESVVKLEKLCSRNPAFRTSDNFMQFLALRYELPEAQSYYIDEFLLCIQKAIDEGCLIQYTNVNQIPDSTVSELFHDIKYQNLKWFICDINVSGSFEFKDSVVFIILNGKIIKTCSTIQSNK